MAFLLLLTIYLIVLAVRLVGAVERMSSTLAVVQQDLKRLAQRGESR